MCIRDRYQRRVHGESEVKEQSSMFNRFLRRGLSQLPHRVKSFDNYKDMKAYVDTTKPIFSCMYFSAAWNPMCIDAEKHVRDLSNRYIQYTFTHLDCDKDVLGRRFYSIKTEPTFIVCCLGHEMVRQVGSDLPNLEEKINRVYEFYKSIEFPKGTNVYEPYEANFMREYNALLREWEQWVR
eukprot:TRINITY_DN201_c0_g1_i1.p1 TRINITY_DN201_c0_g1~~TRINITY_DN201_c0_g1_i1.p1  ORF type:complete len:181 (+),score=48.47 TRINITY_DN201_c0_g1_i1:75-617(+)